MGEQDKTDKDKRIRVTQAVEQDKADKSDKRINFAAFQKTRLYYEGLSSQEKEEFWGRVRRGNKADETKHSGTSHRILPPRCFLLASSWSMIPPDVVMTMYQNCLEGSRLLVHFSISLTPTSNRGEMTPTLFNRPVKLTTILPPL